MRFSWLQACVMPKGRPINNPGRDEAVFAAYLTGETMASISERLGINTWNVNDACKRARNRRRRKSRRNDFADWRDVPIRYSDLSARARDAVSAMNISTMGALFFAVEVHGKALFKYIPNVGPKTIAEVMTWFEDVLNAETPTDCSGGRLSCSVVTEMAAPLDLGMIATTGSERSHKQLDALYAKKTRIADGGEHRQRV